MWEPDLITFVARGLIAGLTLLYVSGNADQIDYQLPVLVGMRLGSHCCGFEPSIEDKKLDHRSGFGDHCLKVILNAGTQVTCESKGRGLMRQGQQNRRNRGRGRTNNRSNNPLSRNYESNGPDVKIKGSAAHIAEKYMALARDSLSAGNPVTAENYFQHAEHYNRIIQAAQAKQEEHAAAQSAKGNNGKPDRHNEGRSRPPKPDGDPPAAKPEASIPGSGDQPLVNGNGNGNAPVAAKPKRKPRPRKPKAAPSEADESKDTTDGSGNIIA